MINIPYFPIGLGFDNDWAIYFFTLCAAASIAGNTIARNYAGECGCADVPQWVSLIPFGGLFFVGAFEERYSYQPIPGARFLLPIMWFITLVLSNALCGVDGLPMIFRILVSVFFYACHISTVMAALDVYLVVNREHMSTFKVGLLCGFVIYAPVFFLAGAFEGLHNGIPGPEKKPRQIHG